jgi:glucose-6-phosphate 1-dehydrogenase
VGSASVGVALPVPPWLGGAGSSGELQSRAPEVAATHGSLLVVDDGCVEFATALGRPFQVRTCPVVQESVDEARGCHDDMAGVVVDAPVEERDALREAVLVEGVGRSHGWLAPLPLDVELGGHRQVIRGVPNHGGRDSQLDLISIRQTLDELMGTEPVWKVVVGRAEHDDGVECELATTHVSLSELLRWPRGHCSTYYCLYYVFVILSIHIEKKCLFWYTPFVGLMVKGLETRNKLFFFRPITNSLSYKMPVKKNTTQPFILTIFGASGDLAKLKIFPSLYELMEQGKFPTRFFIVGYARTKMTKKEFHTIVRSSITKKFGKQAKKKTIDAFLKHVHYFPGLYNELTEFEKYQKFLKVLKKRTKMTHLAYFSVPPVAFKDIVRNLALSRSSRRDDIRLILEKPFGTSCKSAVELFHFVSQYFDEDQFYLLDHYLGKTAVRSIMNLRHSNRILSHMMQGKEIANIQITKFETIGVKERAGYFDAVGIIKDMVQSHLLQLLALVTMDIPVSRSSESLQRERLSVLSALSCSSTDNNVVIGQYNSYKKEHGVAKRSRTETFAAMRLYIDKENWYNIPVYIRTGKGMKKVQTNVVVELKTFDFQHADEEPNRLIFQIAPDEKISMTLLNTQEDVYQYQMLTTSDSIACDTDGCLPEYATLLLDVLHEDHMHFVSFQEVIAAWRVIDKIAKTVKKRKTRLEIYEHGSVGPKSQHGLTTGDGFEWFDTD